MNSRAPMKRLLLAASLLAAAAVACVAAFLAASFAPSPLPERIRPSLDPAETDSGAWGKAFPRQYASHASSGARGIPGRSRYKSGRDPEGEARDRLSQSPALALLLRGSGRGHEWNEPRAHAFAMTDLAAVDLSRSVASGAACLTCKSPHAERIRREAGDGFHRMTLPEALERLPERDRALGVSCQDCHEARTLDLAVTRRAAREGLSALGVGEPSRRDMRSFVCGQCHATFSVLKDAAGRPAGVSFPWEGSGWGAIPVEDIIRRLKGDPARREWAQEVTGMALGDIRHPDFEFYTAGSPHWVAGLACADCHMPYRADGSGKYTDHDVTSPLENGLRACLPCHAEEEEELAARVRAIQDRCFSLARRAALCAATVAKLLETTRAAAAAGRTVDSSLVAEAARIAVDAVTFAGRAEGLLRQALGRAGVDVPAAVPLELSKYVNNRGTRAKEGTLMFQPVREVRDPSGAGSRLFPPAAKGL